MSEEKYIRKQEVVDAIQWLGENHMEITEFIERGPHKHATYPSTGKVIIYRQNGNLDGILRDWITRDTHGELHICSDELFNLHHIPVS